MKTAVTLFWFRRDLRIFDNAALYHALRSPFPVLPLFIFDTEILGKLPDKKDARVTFIYLAVEQIQLSLAGLGVPLQVYHGNPVQVYDQIIDTYDVRAAFANEDYEPYARTRDERIAAKLKGIGVELQLYKDQVIFSKDEILKDTGTPYTVFTPYSTQWKRSLHSFFVKEYPTQKNYGNFVKSDIINLRSLESMGFSRSEKAFPRLDPPDSLITHYGKNRDFPGLDGTSHLGIHLRFGTVSIRRLIRQALEQSDVFLRELIWRDFYHMILWHFPEVGKGKSFKPSYDLITWRNDESQFQQWCQGMTGYPLVDAGMRQLNETGFMHNRVRMVTASFLAKHLLIDWRWGEAYFADKLLDYDLASNNGGWQWAAGSGCDAAPYFRIFNPTLQQQKFDPDGTYIKKWIPELQELSYPQPIVEHGYARARALKAYQQALLEKAVPRF